jgi:hypothetical protein
MATAGGTADYSKTFDPTGFHRRLFTMTERPVRPRVSRLTSTQSTRATREVEAVPTSGDYDGLERDNMHLLDNFIPRLSTRPTRVGDWPTAKPRGLGLVSFHGRS